MSVHMQDGKTVSPRVMREKEALLAAPARVDIERVRSMLEAYKESEGHSAAVRRARFFDKLCSDKTIYIDESPIVGSLTRHKYGSYPLPEIGPRWMKRTDSFRLPTGTGVATAEEKEWIDKVVDYWQDINIFNRTKEIMSESHGVDIGEIQKAGVASEINPGGLMETFPDYAQVLQLGLSRIIAGIDEKKAAQDVGDREGFNKWHFYQATATCLKAIIKLARRYASLARQMALEEPDQARREELERIAETCEWVPANPARNFREAMQSVWFIVLGIWFESPSTGNGGPLRFPQYMYPFYKKDREAGRLTDQETIELIHFYFLKLQSLGQVLPPFGFKYSQARSALHLALGGLTPDGEDATNELDWLVLEAKKQLMVPEPLVLVLYHDKLPEAFLLKCVELVKTGIGQPAFYDARKIVQRNLHHRQGVSLEEARNQAIIPCVQDVIPGYTDSHWEGNFNTVKMLELAMNNGVDPLSGAQIGPRTGELESFQSYEEFHQAVVKQLQYFIPLVRNISRTAWNASRTYFPVPFGSALVHDCLEKGKDMVDGGARYSLGNGTSFVGVVDLANSLVAIRQLVFEARKLTFGQLREALRADFEGYDEVQRMCLEAPKFGNDDEATDSIVRKLYEICAEEHQKLPDFLGRHTLPHAYSVASHGAMGDLTGALPNGRKARVALTDATVSAQAGTDKHGPTALARSAARAIDTVRFGSNHFNMKFHPSALGGTEGARKFLALVKTYLDLGGYHIQFNCVSSQKLREAKAHPEEYRELVVRVAGFSAYFVHLDPIVQDDIIGRTELSFG